MSSPAGRTILVTRPEMDAEEWAARLREIGARPVIFPCLVCEMIDNPATRAALTQALDKAAWLTLTSRRGVEATASLLNHTLPTDMRIAVVGPATAHAARDLFGRADLVPEEATGASLAHALAGWFLDHPEAPKKIAVAAADRAEHTLERILESQGVKVARVAVYRTIPAPPEQPRVRLEDMDLDVILLASPSAVTGLLHRAEVPPGVSIVTIGPSTSAAARAAGLTVAAEARSPGLEGFLEVLP